MTGVPFSNDAEECVISCLIRWPETRPVIFGAGITAKHFLVPKHATFFAIVSELIASNKPVEHMSIAHELEERKQVEEVGGYGTIGLLSNAAPGPSSIQYYVDVMMDKSIDRFLLVETKNMADKMAEQGSGARDEVIERLRQISVRLAQRESTRTDDKDEKFILEDGTKEYDDLFNGKTTTPGILLGIDRLDKIMDGAHPGQLVLIGAKRKHGKSTMLRQWAMSAMFEQGKSVAIISLEMRFREIRDAMVNTLSGVPIRNLRAEHKLPGEFERAGRALSKLSSAKLIIRDEAAASPQQIASAVEGMMLKRPIDIVFVDYLQLIRVPNSQGNEVQDIGAISRAMKIMANNLNVPVVMAVQLNQEGMTRWSQQPEMDCDKLLVIEHENDEPEQGNKVDLWLKLHRGGPTGKIAMRWDADRTTFR